MTVDRIKEKGYATWNFSLTTHCPYCEEWVDLLDEVDFWDGRHFVPCEHGTDRAQNVEVTCPKCGHEFLVDFEY